jgi:hypothetical protein
VKYWVTAGDANYMKMVDVLVKSLSVCSEYKIIVYGLNCDVNIDSPNVIKRRIDFDIDYTKLKVDYTKLHFNLKDRDWGNLFIKYKIASDIAKEFPQDDIFCFIDSDIIALSEIDTIFNHTKKLNQFPLYMHYYHTDITIWKHFGDFKIEAKYGSEICNVFNETRNPFSKILAGGLFLFNSHNVWFFDEVLLIHSKLKNVDFYVWADDRAFSEEVVTNYLFWKFKINQSLPITWVNRNNSSTEIVNYGYNEFIYSGFDLMYDYEKNIPLFIHGPDPTFTEKTSDKLDKVYKDIYINNMNKLMIVAHPDDELIFGGQELIRNPNSYKVVCVSSGYDVVRKSEFISAMNQLGITDYEIWNYSDDLYLPFSDEILVDLYRVINEKSWDMIVTHNPIGEYGHPQHRDLHLKVKSITGDFYVFCKTPYKLDETTLNRKKELLKLYPSQSEIIHQLEVKNGRWYLSKDERSNYIQHSDISKYSVELDVNQFVRCVDK